MSILSKILTVGAEAVGATVDVMTGQVNAAKANIAAAREIVHGTPVSQPVTAQLTDTGTGTLTSNNYSIFLILGILGLILIVSSNKKHK